MIPVMRGHSSRGSLPARADDGGQEVGVKAQDVAKPWRYFCDVPGQSRDRVFARIHPAPRQSRVNRTRQA